MYKIIVLAVLVAVAAAQHYGYDEGFEHGGGYEHGSSYEHGHGYEHGGHDEHESPKPYSFEYSVHDSKTGDFKEAKETRDGDVVKGYYTLKEADGSTREVHYTADKHNGFTAQVTRSGHGHGGHY